MRILGGVAGKADHEAGVRRILAKQIVHLTLCPALIIALTRLGQCQRAKLHCGIITCGAPFILEEVAGAVCLAADIGFCLTVVAGQMSLDDPCAQLYVIPAVGPADIAQCAVHNTYIAVILGGDGQPACRPRDIVLAAVGLIECSQRGFLAVLVCVVEQCLRVGQILRIAEVDVIERQRCGILCGNVAFAATGPAGGTAGALCFR